MVRRCDCENSACKREHRAGDCQEPESIKTLWNSGLCSACAEYMPKEYISSERKETMPDYKAKLNSITQEQADFILKDCENDADIAADQILQDALTPKEYGEMYVEDSEAACQFIKEKFNLEDRE